ncbi:hypothetical protein GCM10027517_20170 [Phycicoccus ginsengisoli]
MPWDLPRWGMAAPTDPYEGSDFTVDLGTGEEVRFSRVDLPVAHVDEVAYRSGTDRSNEPRMQPGRAGYSRLVLTRSLTSDLSLWTWWKAARDGDPHVDRDVRVRLLDATRSPVLAWRFRNAFPAAYRVSPLVAASNELVLETVELVFDSMDVEAT